MSSKAQNRKANAAYKRDNAHQPVFAGS